MRYFVFSQYLEVKNFDAVMGKSDFHTSGKLEDFIPYVFKDKTIRGNFIFTSGVLDLNEFMTSSTSTTAETDTLPLTLVAIPGNIDFRLVSRIDKMYYDKLEIENTIGTILVKDKKIILDSLEMNMLEGINGINRRIQYPGYKKPWRRF